MNSIPWWGFLCIAAVGFLMAIAGNKGKKQGLTLLGTLIQLIGAVLTVASNNGAFSKNPTQVLLDVWTTEAYGVAQHIKTNYSGKKVVVLGWLPGPTDTVPANITNDMAKTSFENSKKITVSYMDALQKFGVDAKYVAIGYFPPIQVSVNEQCRQIQDALDKAGNYDVIVYRTAVLPAKQADIIEVPVIQTNYVADKNLWQAGIVVANIYPKEGVSPQSYPKK